LYLKELLAPLEIGPLLETLCESINAGICLFDEAGRYVLASGSYCAIHGYEPADLLGQPFTLTLPPGVAELSMQIHQDVLDGTNYPAAEWLVRRKDGTNVPVQATNLLLRQSDGARFRVVIVEDLSLRKRLEQELDELRLRLKAVESTDELTQIHSRSALLQMGEQELQRARRYGHPMTLVLFDLDRFRTVNDTNGLAVGDEVLRLVAAFCCQMIRITDTIGRYGGEEFGLILPITDHSGGLKLARRLRKAIATRPWQTTAGPISVTASFGVYTTEADEESFDEALMRASAALYVAKERGRNRVISAASLAGRRAQR
jgi:diguanylate cyclase (GGDEF)-like protein/PAS domain S-box-containing protein